jgi:hypothetical protein
MTTLKEQLEKLGWNQELIEKFIKPEYVPQHNIVPEQQEFSYSETSSIIYDANGNCRYK